MMRVCLDRNLVIKHGGYPTYLRNKTFVDTFHNKPRKVNINEHFSNFTDRFYLADFGSEFGFYCIPRKYCRQVR